MSAQAAEPHRNPPSLATFVGLPVLCILAYAALRRVDVLIVIFVLFVAALLSDAWCDRRAADGRMSDEEFDRLLDAVERAGASAGEPPAELGEVPTDAEFECLVRDAIDELPEFVRAVLERNVAVVISDRGHEHRAYGLYVGGTVACGDYGHAIHIFRDTLVEAFGCDREELRRQVAITVRHEVAHHLGAGEQHVADLGL